MRVPRGSSPVKFGSRWVPGWVLLTSAVVASACSLGYSLDGYSSEEPAGAGGTTTAGTSGYAGSSSAGVAGTAGGGAAGTSAGTAGSTTAGTAGSTTAGTAGTSGTAGNAGSSGSAGADASGGSSGSTAGSAGDGGSAGAAGTDAGSPTCANNLQDDFDDGSIASHWIATDALIVEQSGELVFPLQPSTSNYAMVFTADKWDLTCSPVWVKITQTTQRSATGPQTYVYVTSGSNFLYFVQEGGTVTVSRETGAVQSVPYSPTSDLWWRIRTSGTDWYWETSADGVTWQERVHAAVHFDLSSVTIWLGAGDHVGVANPGTARFDCYNVPAPCP